MKKIKLTTTRIAAMAAVLVCCLMTSCQGRTMHNMEPNGDTVEVMPDTLTDSIQ